CCIYVVVLFCIGIQVISDFVSVAEMKANPAKLTIEAGVEISSESDNSIMHITRGGSLIIQGGPEYFKNNDTPADSQGMVPLNI
ncbi:hypothetical protein Q4595_28795, partial [Wenyingzhuangia sp. 1_MG-2023]|nr:hypothetical protein [Wenyingzhuangia sp. 1_MG-2023]